jgi:hypothetical protein
MATDTVRGAAEGSVNVMTDFFACEEDADPSIIRDEDYEQVSMHAAVRISAADTAITPGGTS